MERLLANEIVSPMGGELLQGDPCSSLTGVSTDTRTIERGDLFFALKGEHADGHRYLGDAAKAGAAGVVVSDASAVPVGSSVLAIRVDDTLRALGDLAKYYRARFRVRAVGITGSVGKTTTKEMLASVLGRRWNVLKNEANYNNEIGVPLTLLQLQDDHEAAVIEMAMRGAGEIRRLADIAQPSVGLITNIGITHIQRLGSRDAIADAKLELLDALPSDGLAIVNADDDYFERMKDRFDGRVISFGLSGEADVRASDVVCSGGGRCSFALLAEDESVQVNLPVLGYHNVPNALAAAAAAIGMGLDLHAVQDGLESFTLPGMRMDLINSKVGCSVLNDAYNASPASMLSALQTLSGLAGYRRKIAVLGDMLELGDCAYQVHKDIGSSLAQSGVDMLVTVGPLASSIAEGALEAGFPSDYVIACADSSEAAGVVAGRVEQGDVVLVKGSRGVRMEKIVRVLVGE